MGSGGSGKGSRGRGRRRPRGGGGGGGGGSRPGGPKGPPMMPSPRKGKAFSTPYEVPDTGPIDPFDLFSALFMGLMPDGTYRGAGIGEVAKRFRRSPGEIQQMLHDYGMDPDTLSKVDFDLNLAKLDIQVAPEGIDRREIARGLFEEFCDLHPTLTCGPMPVAVGGNGGRPQARPDAEAAAPGGHAPDADEGAETEAEPAREAPTDEAPEAGSPAADEPPAEAAEEPVAQEDMGQEGMAEDDLGDDGEDEPLAAVDAGVTRGAPAHERHGRPVRQIRRSPTRRGR
jgi:hypothetical protein